MDRTMVAIELIQKSKPGILFNYLGDVLGRKRKIKGTLTTAFLKYRALLETCEFDYFQKDILTTYNKINATQRDLLRTRGKRKQAKKYYE